MENIFFAPRRALRVQLAGLRDFLRVTHAPKETINSIPKDPRSCSSQFRLDPVTRAFLSCPKCFCLSPYDPSNHPSIDHPGDLFCGHKKTPQSLPCDALLWKKREIGPHRTVFTPIRKYLHQDLKFWMGRLLSRKGMEDIIDNIPRGPPKDPDEPIHDIWTSKVFLRLKDIDGNPFFPSMSGEGRLVFSLAVDSFNPFHMKTAKQQVSSTGIWLVLLNLPPHLRYLPENMFLVGVLPGKPSMDEMNHSLQLVVKDLLQFWDPGVTFSRTFNHHGGRLYKGMLVPLIADMLAARQVIGLPGAPKAHSFCTFCDLDIDDLDVLDRDEWPEKDVEHIRRFARLWKDASNEADQQSIFNACGLRWTALLDLPYWNPVLYSVIDSMHALDLNLFQNHCRELFKIDVQHPGGDGSITHPIIFNKRSPDEKAMAKCLNKIRTNEPGLRFDLLQFHRKVLYTICLDLDIRGTGHKLVVGTKWILANNIHLWVRAIFYYQNWWKLSIMLSSGRRTTNRRLRMHYAAGQSPLKLNPMPKTSPMFHRTNLTFKTGPLWIQASYHRETGLPIISWNGLSSI